MDFMGRFIITAMLGFTSVANVARIQGAPQQGELHASGRQAAFAFAVRAGLKVPDSAVFVREPDPADGMEGRTVTPTTSPLLTADAEAMVKATGRGARAGFALDFLKCARACSVSTRYAVVASGEVTRAGSSGLGVLVILYEPPSRETGERVSRTSATVIVERVGNSWRAVGFHPRFVGLKKVLEPRKSLR